MEQENLYNIVLTKDQAETLRIVCGYIGGSTVRSRRKYMDGIRQQLIDKGFKSIDHNKTYLEDKYATLNFVDELPVTKMSLEDVEKILGYPVEIV